MEFKSERLYFREFGPDDYNKYSSVFSNEIVMRYAYMDKIADENEMISCFDQVIKNAEGKEKRNSYEFAVSLSSNNDFVGYACILVNYHFSRVKFGEIGYFLLPQHWGKGYATEIADTLTDICFTNLHMHKVAASCNINNPRSENVMKKIGMIKEAELRKERYKDGRWDNELRYGILLEEWEEKHK
jgi:ribosomal-protein-alanine N-acetyltransferase